MQFCVALVLALMASANAGSLRNGRSSLETDMQPEMVAKTLKNVEDMWKEQAAAFIHCNATRIQPFTEEDCAASPSAFGKSCAVVVGAVVQGSSGDKSVAQNYMADVCSQSLLKGWHQQHCLGLKAALNMALTADSYSNRESFTSSNMCKKFFSEFVEEEKKRFVKEEAERMAAEKKAAEEAAKKAKEAAEKAAEKAAKEKEEAAKAAKIAKEEADKQIAEEAARKKIEEAKRVKEEAQVKAAESAEKLAKKKVEAAEFAVKAQQKMEEAAEAERVHKNALANLNAKTESTVAVLSKKEAVPVSKKQEDAPEVAIKSASKTTAEAAIKPKNVVIVVAKATAKPEKLATASAAKTSVPVAPVKAASVAEKKK